MEPTSRAAGGVRCHFVWLGSRLPYYARLAIESALVAMPDAEVHLHHVGPVAAGEHAAAVLRYPRAVVHAAPLPAYFEDAPGGAQPYLDLLDRAPHGSPAAISNLVRLAILRRHGGVYLDTDVLVVRGLHDPELHGAFVGQELVWAANRDRVEGRFDLGDAFKAAPWALTWLARRSDAWALGGRARLADRLPDRSVRAQVNNAVIGAPAGSAFVLDCLERALSVDPSRRFALGPSLLDDVARQRVGSVRLVPPSRFFPVPPGQSYRLFEDARFRLPVDTQVVHYVASNHRRLMAELEPNDPRMTAGRGVFWTIAGEVAAAAAAGMAGTERPRRLLRSVG